MMINICLKFLPIFFRVWFDYYHYSNKSNIEALL